MKRTLTLLTAIACLAMFNGCTGMSKLAKELAKDPATVSIDVQTLYGSMTFRRSNASSNHSSTVSGDGSITVDNIHRATPPLVSADYLGIVTSAAVESAIKNSKK